MKLFVSGASTIPAVTPVATATTLPPSITALQQQGTEFLFTAGIALMYVRI